MTNDDDENLLVLLVQSGDMAAFEKLLLCLYEPLRKYVTKLVGIPMAEDVMQEVALRVFQNVRHLRETRAFRPWVYRIATRIAFVHVTREKIWRVSETDTQLLPAAVPFESTNQQESDSELLSIVDRLSPASRAVLLLHYQQNLSIDETAAILEIPVGTAKSRLAYGVAKLRDLLKENKST
jgi:RNA polymerase sigma-70 factor (ECF subfamily)